MLNCSYLEPYVLFYIFLPNFVRNMLEIRGCGSLEGLFSDLSNLALTYMMKFENRNNDYVSPVAEVVDLLSEGVLLSGSKDVGLGFDFEDGEMVEGDEIIIGG